MEGYYALTICARDKAHLFGILKPGESFQPSALGQLVLPELVAIPTHFPTVRLDTWVLMPNHLHCIVVLTRNQAVNVSTVVGSFKSRCYAQWRKQLVAAGQSVPASCWQRDYYEHIIRDANELDGYRKYILGNPSRW